ncbi:hypothetical protein A2U01_0089091 [Trifolium medium]|uniref:Uncharacterized protein n=1 Tax=Trifolium medium TaxID=97028 RepID=A0A392U3E0_9FABA|nr:hypothetical protein [Trifolium medium]
MRARASGEQEQEQEKARVLRENLRIEVREVVT